MSCTTFRARSEASFARTRCIRWDVLLPESSVVGAEDRAEFAILKRVAASVGSSLPLPRLLLVFAHPDDEVLAVGGRLERMRDSHLLTLTDGAPLDGVDARQHGFSTLAAYRAGRRGELRAALADAHLPPDFLLPLEGQVADQTACMHLAGLTRQVADILVKFAPEAVLTHPYEGGHPDHDACCFAVHTAVRKTALVPAPVILEAPFYNAGEGGSMRTGVFIETGEPALTAPLSSDEAVRKRARLACFGSQAETLAQFGIERESFRVAPAYDFLKPPHPGKLFYEGFDWGMRGGQFCQLAHAAIEDLQRSGADWALAGGTKA